MIKRIACFESFFCCFLILFSAPLFAGIINPRPDDVIEMSCGDNNTAGTSVLVAYDTRHGATGTVAEKIAQALCELGATVDIKLVSNVKSDDLSSYNAVIVGSPIYISSWLRGARKFLKEHESILSEKQVGIFVTCTYLKEDTPEIRDHIQENWIDSVLENYPAIEPLDTEAFAGEFEYSELYPVEYFIMKLAGYEEGDFRDFDKMSMWAEKFFNLLD